MSLFLNLRLNCTVRTSINCIPNLLTSRPSARMSLGSSTSTAEQETIPSAEIAVTLPIATTILEKAEREKLEKLVNGACSARSEGRSGLMPRFVFIL